MGMMKALLDQRLEENKYEMWEALLAVYKDIELQDVEGGSDELNQMVRGVLMKIERLPTL